MGVKAPLVIQKRDSTKAVSNTGPLISAFQSNSLVLLTKILDRIYLPAACVAELVKHGWENEIQAASSWLMEQRLNANEEKRALIFAERIAHHPSSKDAVVKNHLAEAQAIVLALRREHSDDLLLIDELAAREIANREAVNLSGFPGLLLLARRLGLISPDDLKQKLELCRRQGTHYSEAFIKTVYEMANWDRR